MRPDVILFKTKGRFTVALLSGYEKKYKCFIK